MKPTFFGQNTVAAGGAEEASDWDDDFNRASLGGDWEETVGNVGIGSNMLIFVDGGETNTAMRTEPMTSRIQYQKATLVIGAGLVAIGFIFRATAFDGAGYLVAFDAGGDRVYWNHYSDIAAGDDEQEIASQAMTVTNGDVMAVTIEGSGDSTVVRIWRNPSGLPNAANDWNGDTTPTLTLTSNPPTPANTGLYVGVTAVISNTNGAGIDNWFGGCLV